MRSTHGVAQGLSLFSNLSAQRMAGSLYYKGRINVHVHITQIPKMFSASYSVTRRGHVVRTHTHYFYEDEDAVCGNQGEIRLVGCGAWECQTYSKKCMTRWLMRRVGLFGVAGTLWSGAHCQDVQNRRGDACSIVHHVRAPK
jgi:hypothetical protein